MWKTRIVTKKWNIKNGKQEEREEKDSDWMKSEVDIIDNIINNEIHDGNNKR